MDGLYGNATVSMHITCKAYLIDTCWEEIIPLVPCQAVQIGQENAKWIIKKFIDLWMTWLVLSFVEGRTLLSQGTATKEGETVIAS